MVKLKRTFRKWLVSCDKGFLYSVVGALIAVFSFACGLVLGATMNAWMFLLFLGIPVGVLLCIYGFYLEDERWGL